MDWNYGDILDAIEPVLPGASLAYAHGERQIVRADATARSNNLARALIEAGLDTGDKVAFYMRNRPEYCETLAACFKARLTHVNVNYRYKPSEVHYIFENSDAKAIVYGAEFRENVKLLRPKLPGVRAYIEIDDGESVAPFAGQFETLANTGDGKPLRIDRSPEDMLFIYTGGTTGMPKGVMWRHSDLREAQIGALRRLGPVPETLEALVAALKQAPPTARLIPACPLMHGTGLLTALGTMMGGGAIITLAAPSFDAEELWQEAARHKGTSISIVGDAFAKPMLRALDESPGKYDLSSLLTIVSSGVMWSAEVKRGLLRHIQHVVLGDSFGASEGLGFGASFMTAAGETKTAKFQIGEHCTVFDEAGNAVVRGSGALGIIAMTGPIPVGYYKDPEKSASTFKTIGGKRYVVPGDWCTVEADGSLTLVGRGSVCINTAGEKVFPEEVEEILKTHPSIEDALVVGVPDEKWGQAVVGVVRLSQGSALDEAALRTHVRERLAGYKTPKRVVVADVALRAPNGKADYKSAGESARRAIA